MMQLYISQAPPLPTTGSNQTSLSRHGTRCFDPRRLCARSRMRQRHDRSRLRSTRAFAGSDPRHQLRSQSPATNWQPSRAHVGRRGGGPFAPLRRLGPRWRGGPAATPPRHPHRHPRLRAVQTVHPRPSAPAAHRRRHQRRKRHRERRQRWQLRRPSAAAHREAARRARRRRGSACRAPEASTTPSAAWGLPETAAVQKPERKRIRFDQSTLQFEDEPPG
mmetsp:Transcript_54989/g.178058  ORF Transcript_54989/g.178058 Transcript_54989/m.178058 type:complete len:220 (+) Transcript_54989:404-1063(+)